MKLVVTGATGFVGREMVPVFQDQGHELLLVGRDTDKIGGLFPNVRACTFEDLAQAGAGFDMVLHLAVLNNTANADQKAFDAVNVDLFASVIDAAKVAGVPRVVNVTSFHALDPHNTAPYAASKRKALEMARAAAGIDVVNVFLPAVHGKTYAGKLAMLNRLPEALSGIAFQALSSLAATVEVGKLADFVTDDARRVDPAEDHFLFDPKARNIFYRFGKRLIDLMFVLAVVLLLWWLLLFVWLRIRFTSEGPGIFAQTRVGQGGHTFTCLKFRTMQQNTVQAGTHDVSASAVTPFGAFLRKTKIDELPQVWNILRGEISLIGPRPCLPVQTELVEARRKRGVLDVVPGISGLAQINDVDMSDPEYLAKFDAQYVARQSLLLDIKIILATVRGSGQGDRTAQS